MSDIRHFIDLADLTTQELKNILEMAHIRKKKRDGKTTGFIDTDTPLQDHTLALVFGQPSTRTRASFTLAIRQLGGKEIIINERETQLGRGETLSDTAETLSRYSDMIMIRTPLHNDIKQLSENISTTPIINGLTSHSHPCQIVADIMTFEEHKGSIEGRKITWLGDGNNVSVSWIHAATLLNFEFHLAIPEGCHPPIEMLKWAKDNNGNIQTHLDVRKAVENADALYTDTWASMHMNNNPESHKHILAPYRVTPELMAETNDALFMHCLPAYRGQEVVAEVIDGPQSVVFEQAENRIHAQKAILLWCMNL